MAKQQNDTNQSNVDRPHARNYPGRALPKAEKVREEAAHDAAELKRGLGNSMGVSADGSHKGLPSSKDEIGRHVNQPAAPAFAHSYPGRKLPKA